MVAVVKIAMAQLERFYATPKVWSGQVYGETISFDFVTISNKLQVIETETSKPVSKKLIP